MTTRNECKEAARFFEETAGVFRQRGDKERAASKLDAIAAELRALDGSPLHQAFDDAMKTAANASDDADDHAALGKAAGNLTRVFMLGVMNSNDDDRPTGEQYLERMLVLAWKHAVKVRPASRDTDEEYMRRVEHALHIALGESLREAGSEFHLRPVQLARAFTEYLVDVFVQGGFARSSEDALRKVKEIVADAEAPPETPTRLQ